MKLIILDRDGVINFDRPDYIKHPDEWEAIPGSLHAIALLNQAGYRIVIASNQSGIARGYYTEDMFLLINEKMHQQVSQAGGHIDKIFYCPHAPNKRCGCRKPEPGLLNQIANTFNCSLKNVPMVGDRFTDVLVAQKVGALPLMVRTGYVNDIKEFATLLKEIAIYDNLLCLVEALLKKEFNS